MSRVATCVLALSVSLVWLGGCAACFEPAPTTQPALKMPEQTCGEADTKKLSYYLPGGKKGCGSVLVEKVAPHPMLVGRPAQYQIMVTNLARGDLQDVVLHEAPMANFKISTTTPEAAKAKDGSLTWKLGTMKPGDTRLVTVEGAPTEVTTLRACSEVTYRMEPVCMPITAVQPELAVTKAAPSEVMLCDPIPLKIVVSNPGTWVACNVTVHDKLPEGWTTTDGADELTFHVAELKPGASREFTAHVRAASTGTYENMATATADGGLKASSSKTKTSVVKPALSVTKKGPSMRYIGLPITYEITVANGAGAPARNTVLTDALPDGAMLVEASDGGQRSGDKVVWDLGTLQPKQSKKVSLTVKALTACTLTNVASAKAYCDAAEASARTVVKGIPAILLECVDVTDPVEVGAQTTYVITVTNQGSSDGTNIAVACTLPPEEELVSAGGATEGTAKGKAITFAPLARLAPKDRATWRVVVKGVKAGDVRFKVSLKSDQIQDPPVAETESTHIYE